MSDTPRPSAKVPVDPLRSFTNDQINVCMVDPELREKVFHALNNPPPVESKPNEQIATPVS